MNNINHMLLILVTLLITSCNSNSNSGNESNEIEVDNQILDTSGLPIIEFEIQTPLMLNNAVYTIDLAEWNIPNNGTEALTTTVNLQAAIDWAYNENYNQVILPAGEYLVGEDVNNIYYGGIEVHDNTELVFNDATLIMETNNKWNYCVLRLNGNNIIIRDGTIRGDIETHIFTPRDSDGKTAHDEGHGICIKNNNQVLVKNMELVNLTGDGSLVLDSNDITFADNKIYNNRRQGISVVGGVNIEIKDNEIHHISGISPQFGIDIEGAGRIDENIIIQKNYFHHNSGGDIANTSGKNVFILDNVMEQGNGSSYVDGPIVSWNRTHNIIARNTITMETGSVNGRLGYIQYSHGREKGHNLATYVHENVCNNCGMYMYKSADADVRRNKFYGYFAAFSEFKNLTLIDNLVTYSDEHTNLRYCWTYRFEVATGFASGNYIGDSLEEIPLLSNDPYSLQCVLDGW